VRGPRDQIGLARVSSDGGAMDVLVTGISGFVGQHLARALVTGGHRVTGLVRPGGSETIPGDVVVIEADVTDPDAVRSAFAVAQPDAVIHLAGASSVGASFAEPRATWEVNLGGTLAVLEGSRALAISPRTLVITSGEIYGRVAPSALPVTEATPLSPLSPYGASKAAADLAAEQYHLGYGLPVIRVRPFNHIGPGQDARFVVPNIARQIAQAERAGRDHADIQVGSLTTRRDFTDVRDVVRAYTALLATGAPGAPYLVCSGRSIAIGELIDRIVRLTPVDVRLVTSSALERIGEQPDLYGDAHRLRAETGWRPEIDLDQTLADTLDWWRARVAD
jgi:GDP-4-dehydro-6-deoxy-D-mannose reductase